MKTSLLLGQVYKIKLYVHWSFILLLIWVLMIKSDHGLTLDQAVLRILFIIALFTCVVLHELGHALTARQFGYQTRRIILMPIGGMAEIERMPENPKEELLVAIAGPIVSFIIAALLYIFANISSGIPDTATMQGLNIDSFINQYFLFYLCLVNLMLAIFNLIPAFPMDGGRILRAFLAIYCGRIKATKISATIGQFLSIIFIILGLNSFNIWLIIIGGFIFLAAKTEAMGESIKLSLSQYKVKDLTMHKYSILNFNDNIQKAIALILDSQEKEFLIVNGQKIVGFLTKDDIIRALHEKKDSLLIYNVMSKKFLKLSPNMNLQDAYEQMIVNRFNVAAVIDDDKLIGILDMENIQEFMLFRNNILK